MNKIEVETWALRILDAVCKGAAIEDDYVELKADWSIRKFATKTRSHEGAL
jgi:hypothetical protein